MPQSLTKSLNLNQIETLLKSWSRGVSNKGNTRNSKLHHYTVKKWKDIPDLIIKLEVILL